MRTKIFGLIFLALIQIAAADSNPTLGAYFFEFGDTITINAGGFAPEETATFEIYLYESGQNQLLETYSSTDLNDNFYSAVFDISQHSYSEYLTEARFYDSNSIQLTPPLFEQVITINPEPITIEKELTLLDKFSETKKLLQGISANNFGLFSNYCNAATLEFYCFDSNNNCDETLKQTQQFEEIKNVSSVLGWKVGVIPVDANEFSANYETTIIDDGSENYYSNNWEQQENNLNGFGETYELPPANDTNSLEVTCRPYDNGEMRNFGDANGDGMITNIDSFIINSLFLGLTTAYFQGDLNDSEQNFCLDVTGDGLVTNLDSLMVQQKFLGNIAEMSREGSPEFKPNGIGIPVWEPNLVWNGEYEIEVWVPIGTGNNEYLIKSGDSNSIVTVNKENENGEWISLGIHYLEAGNTYVALLYNETAMADAVRLIPKNLEISKESHLLDFSIDDASIADVQLNGVSIYTITTTTELITKILPTFDTLCQEKLEEIKNEILSEVPEPINQTIIQSSGGGPNEEQVKEWAREEVQGDLDSLSQQIAELEERIEALEEQIADFETTEINILQEISRIENEINNSDDSSEIVSLQNQLTGLERKASLLEKEINRETVNEQLPAIEEEQINNPVGFAGLTDASGLLGGILILLLILGSFTVAGIVGYKKFIQ